ncbi:2-OXOGLUTARATE (2OG) AND FE(II)-DEPENDENT OXYGENASE SUPERFAMILY PROTEIN-RELATED [Salix koriyanagi]|uniref:2-OXOGLUTARATE (2OG) AND FE(II)-DEPENDENT OXYGENASE SUPERFAMILY PROTEIN-RELATED n=1 Tax=Salix koriyanagi TaxID=2511006 RepID=A0A9Q0Q6F8_9ROSI|nr:2-OXOGLUTARATE (2OG) AND FE(II)-DEPENDENT OXYGENASE SUPERFAMILY PROTEIN-RELATED [Salix koriyanagi]
MAVSPESMPENFMDFRAPPPSPIASGRRSSVTNDEVLTEFLEHSLRVPDLILPDRIFPRHKTVETPPRIDFQSLSEFIRSVSATAAGIFQLPPEKKEAVSRSLERPYGFEEVHGDHQEAESEVSEDFVWCKNESLTVDMEGIWPTGYSNFSQKMETLSSDIEHVARNILQVLHENCPRKSMYGDDTMQRQDPIGSVCCLYKHGRSFQADQRSRSSGYDVMRMLIRGTDYSHALCFHLCDGSSEFHVYSKKGWVSFCPDKDALIVTVGDRTQVWSDGQYKYVFGWPVFEGEDEDSISMAFLCSLPSSSSSSSKTSKEKTFSLGQQAILAIILTLVCHFLFLFLQGVLMPISKHG